jgi:hypothetical protein
MDKPPIFRKKAGPEFDAIVAVLRAAHAASRFVTPQPNTDEAIAP